MAPIEKTTILVWDAPTRLFHWLIVALVAAAYVTQKLNWMDWHAMAGDGVLVLLLFRLAWGACGGETARFAGFLASPRATIAYLKHVSRREPDVQIGHNPAGGWMVLALLGLLLGETLTGLYALNDIAQAGPLTELTPAHVANLIDALHSNSLASVAGRRDAACPGDRRLQGGDGPRSADADDYRPQDAAQGDGASEHGFARTGGAPARRQRPRRRRADQFPLTGNQPFGGVTWPRISPAGFTFV